MTKETTGIDQIRRLQHQRDRLEDMLRSADGRLYDEIMPVFRAFIGDVKYLLALESVVVTDTDVLACFGHPDDGPDEYSLPHWIFESESPVIAAREFGVKRRKENERKGRQAERDRLMRRLGELDGMYASEERQGSS